MGSPHPGTGTRSRDSVLLMEHAAPLGDGLVQASPLLARFAADQEAIIATLLGATDPGPVIAIGPGPGDLDEESEVSFADGRKVTYQRDGVAARAWFSRVADWLNERIPLATVRAAATVPRPGYGWAEYIERRPPASPAEAAQFYLRSGVLLAVLYTLDAADIPDGMLVPSGGQPVLTDVTAFFRPSATASPADPAADLLAASVYRTGLLPAAGLDDWPAAGGQAPESADAESVLLDGFRLGYAAIADNRDEFAALIESARDLAGRGDWPHRGHHLSDVPDQPRPDLALDKLGHLGEVDRRDQEWIISAALATAWPAHGHRSAEPLPTPTPLAGVAAEPSRLLTTACGLADQIVSRGMSSRPGNGPARVNWLDLQMDASAQWVVAPMGAGLADGYVGVALFLAQLADLTGIGRYAEVARLAVSPIPAWLGRMKGQPEPSPALRGAGFDGLGGISYGLARMATLFHETQVGEWADTAVELASATRDPADPPGWADGSAGCLAAMTATHSELGSSRAQALAMVTADRLAEFVDRADGWCPPEGASPPVGFATGRPGSAGRWPGSPFPPGSPPT